MSTGINRVEPLLSVDKLKSRFLFGVKLTDDDGNELDKEILENAILSAVSWLEHELDISITPRTYTENRDFIKTDYFNWGYLNLYHYPVVSVTSWKARYPLNTELFEYPSEWYRIYEETGQLQLVPTAGTISTWFISAGGYMPYVMSKASIPQFFEIEYIAGFPNDEIPLMLNKLIGLKASIDVFHIVGDLIAGAGIANYSVGLDGLSQSVGTTSSATNSGYGARVLNYEKAIKNDLKVARRYYKGGIQMAVS